MVFIFLYFQVSSREQAEQAAESKLIRLASISLTPTS